VRIVVVGGSASNVGKTALAAYLLRGERAEAKVALKVSVRERPCDLRVLVLTARSSAEHRRDCERLLAAGATHVVWVTVQRQDVRSGLASGLRRVRALRPEVVVVESTSAGIELARPNESWFVAGTGEWKPWAERHRVRAHRVLTTDEVYRLVGDPARYAAASVS
jgi:beta-phosphoglucomutase-like phosphatase (HAD superfamily)